MKDHFQHIIQKYSEGKLTLKEQIMLSEQMADPTNIFAEQILLDDWKSRLETEVNPNLKLMPVLDQVHHRIRLNEGSKSRKLNWVQTFQRIAAIMIIPLLLSFSAYLYSRAEKPDRTVSFAEIRCPLGVRTKFQLPDGSTGFLNSGSLLKYPVLFARERKVELTGEAFFDVIQNIEIPFYVNTKNLKIKVFGTSFNVNANENEALEEIVLQTGKVEVISKNGEQLAFLKPNEQLALNTGKLTFTKKEVIASQYSSWKEGKLVFRNENMHEVARRLSRWYNAEVVVDDPLLNDYSFHATFIDEPLDEVLKLLSITTPISYKEEKRIHDTDGTYQKRKIILRVNKLKINQFR
jgi:transmembrane sensor